MAVIATCMWPAGVSRYRNVASIPESRSTWSLLLRVGRLQVSGDRRRPSSQPGGARARRTGERWGPVPIADPSRRWWSHLRGSGGAEGEGQVDGGRAGRGAPGRAPAGVGAVAVGAVAVEAVAFWAVAFGVVVAAAFPLVVVWDGATRGGGY